MTRSSKVGAGSPGFTLLELIISLFILMLLMGMAVVGTRNAFADEEIRTAVREFQIVVKTARKDAQEQNRTQEVLLREHSWEVRQLPDSLDTENPDQPSPEPKVLSYTLPGKVMWEVKRWGSSRWESPEDITWLFTPSGLCAPHRFRFERNKSWMEFSINPLTANPQEEDFYLP